MRYIIFATFFLILLVNSVSALPGDWWGTVKIASLTAPDGTEVTAHINNRATAAATTTVGAVVSGYYLIHVEATSADSINFKVCGIDVEQSAQSWSEGDHPRLDLSISKSCGTVTPTSITPTSPSQVPVEEKLEKPKPEEKKELPTEEKISKEIPSEEEKVPKMPTGLLIGLKQGQLIIVIAIAIAIISAAIILIKIKLKKVKRGKPKNKK